MGLDFELQWLRAEIRAAPNPSKALPPPTAKKGLWQDSMGFGRVTSGALAERFSASAKCPNLIANRHSLLEDGTILAVAGIASQILP